MCIYACRYGINVCMDEYQVSTFMSLYKYMTSLKKYGCHMAKISHTAIMLNEHIYLKVWHQCAKTQSTTISTSHYCQIFAKLICPSNATYMQINSCAHETTMLIYMPHMNSMQSTKLPGVMVYIHYWYMPHNILPSCPHGISTRQWELLL